MSINATLFGQMLTFALFIWFTMRYVWPQLEAALSARQEEVAKGLSQGAEGRKVLSEAHEQVSQLMREAREKSGLIIEQAHKRATVLMEEAKAEAISERDFILEQGRHQLAHERKHASELLVAEVSDLALLSAQSILGRSFNAKDQQSLLSSLR